MSDLDRRVEWAFEQIAGGGVRITIHFVEEDRTVAWPFEAATVIPDDPPDISGTVPPISFSVVAPASVSVALSTVSSPSLAQKPPLGGVIAYSTARLPPR